MIDLFATKTNFIADNETVQVQIMDAYDVHDLGFAFDSQQSSSSAITLLQSYSNVIGFQTERVTVNFEINVMEMLARTFEFMFLVAGIMAIYVVHRNRTRPQTPEEEVVEKVVPVRELREFVKLYEEKSAIGLDMDKARRFNTTQAPKEAYNKLVKSLEDKLKETNEQLKPFKEILLGSDDKIINLIQQLDYNEAEKISVKDSAS